MANLVFLFGPPAVGKAAVGHELAEITGFRFFHNHLTADPAAALFGWDSPVYSEAVLESRLWYFRKALSQPNAPSIIFTFVWGLDDLADNQFVGKLVSLFAEFGGEVFFVELVASVETRLAREGTPFRMALKPFKRNVEAARQTILKYEKAAQMNTRGTFSYPHNHLILNTEYLSPEESALRIADHFKLPGKDV